MPQVYEVQYQINVNNGPALEAINQFQQATTRLEQMSRRFDLVAQKIGKLNSAFKHLGAKPVTVQVNTKGAESGLRRVLTLMKSVQTRSKMNLSAPDMGKLATSMQKVQKLTNAVNRNTIKPKANTKNAINSLDALLRKINQIKANKNITITASASGAASATGGIGRGSSTRTVVPTRIAQPGHSTYLYPSTRQVLGPTYAQTGTNVAGEMVKGMGIAYGLSALMSGVSNVFKSATAYENVSQTTKNILGAHDKSASFEGNFESMNQLMRQVGVETKFTAPQVASAGKFLAMAGYKTSEIQQSIRPISNLALIGDSDLGETADVVTNIMTGYEIPANQMNNVADILTMTFTKSNTTLMELAESFKYAGTVARQSGLEFETTAAAIGVLGDAGIKASHAGTTLRMMLMNMQAPTKKQKAAWKALGLSPKDEAGNLKDFNTLMAELNQKSKEMSSGDFTSLFYQAFRVTAATGAMALVRHADKLQEVTNLNKYNSSGLSTELADAKKNTIEGLWYQMTSAFTESGMKGFEAMQGTIRDFLQRMIQLMKSPDFVEALSSAMQMFLKLVEVITDVFQGIMKFWNILPNWTKDGFVYFVKIQMTLGIVAGIAQSILSTFMMVRGVLFGSWLVGITRFAATMGRTLQYAVQLYGLSRFAGLGRMASLGQAVGRGVFGAAGLMGAGTGVAGAGVSAAGAVGVASASGGLTLMSMMSSVGSFLLTNPIGWSVMAAGAIAWIGYEIYDTYQKTQAAIKANEAWGASYRNLGIDKLNLSDPDALMIGNMRIFNNELLTQNERVAQATELWKRYWQEKNNKPQTTEDGTKFADLDTPAAKNFKEMLTTADMWSGVHKSFTPLLEALGGNIMRHDYWDKNGNIHSTQHLNLFGRAIDLGQNPEINENAAVQLLLAQLGADPNNEQRMALEKFMISQASGAHSYTDFTNIISSARKQFIPTTYNTRWDWISSETAEDMTFADIKNSQMYVRALQSSMEQVFSAWNDFGVLLQNYDKTNTVDYGKAQEILQKFFGPLFDTQYGLYGSEGYMKYIKDIVDNPKKYGYDSVKQATDMINESFDKLVGWYNTLDNHYKPLFASFLNRSPLEGALPSGHFIAEGGYQNPTKEGQTMTADGVSYKSKFFSPTGAYIWVDKKGNQYTPKTSKETQTWSPTHTGGGGKHTPVSSLHNGTDQSQYKSHYNQSAAPKQVIVRIENLMRVDKQTIDMTDGRQVATVNNIKQQLATALLDVVQDFNSNIV